MLHCISTVSYQFPTKILVRFTMQMQQNWLVFTECLCPALETHSELRPVCLKGICVGELQREISFLGAMEKWAILERVHNPALVS